MIYQKKKKQKHHIFFHMQNQDLENKEWQVCKTGELFRGGNPGGGRGGHEKGCIGVRMTECFICMYKNRIMKPVKIV
jgi:hypothetical protein